MKIKLVLLAILMSAPLFWGCDQNKPMNVIFLIGDGMGLSQLSSAYYFGEGEPQFSRFKDIGLIKTHSGSHKITDSAAGATAFASGIKSYNGAIGVDMDKKSVPTVLEQLNEKGYTTAVISTSSITHATPACFYAHVEERGMQDEIAAQLSVSKVDFFAGGGTNFFVRRADGKNLLGQLSVSGFNVDTTDISQPITDFSKRPAYLMAPDGMPPVNKDRGDFLTQATDRALEYVQGKKAPFFIMIESAQIDWAGHYNDSDYLIAEMLEFDKIVGQVLDFAEKEGNTMVIVTADHETGGFTLSPQVTVDTTTGKSKSDYDIIVPTFSNGGHSSSLIPIFAWGKGSREFGGIYENTRVFNLIRQYTGLE
jgi:alkaline phosphatase